MICIPIMSRTTEHALQKMDKAMGLADILELRLDVMESFNLEKILSIASKPVIVTYRSKKEGGRGSANYGTQIQYLRNALEAGADFVDVEHGMPQEFRQSLFEKAGGSRLIVSTHLLDGTPTQGDLESLLRRLAATGASTVKIVTRARSLEDNLRVLNLIPMAQRLEVSIIAFCMGSMGRLSRIASPLLGGYLTFASLEKGEESADGQIPVIEMKKILDMLSL